MVTGEYHDKLLMALYTRITFVWKFLHTQVNHILLCNGKRDTNTGNMRPDSASNGPVSFHKSCSGTAPFTYTPEAFTVCTSLLCQFMNRHQYVDLTNLVF